jgi:zinc transport system substrate-binding protein
MVAPMKVGITLHPYYSWAKNVVAGTDVEIRPILPGEIDAGNYQPSPDDIKKLADLDAIIVNGIGHDDFIQGMITASGNRSITVIRANEGTPLIDAKRGGSVNSHTFISFTNAIQETYAIERALSRLRPELAEKFKKNASAYAQRLRSIKTKGLAALANAKVKRVVTVHDGYGYLMQEMGIEIAGVVEPSHGLVPSAAELESLIDLLKKEHVRIVFSEETFPAALLDVLKESGAEVHLISHIATGKYAADKFEIEMQKNVDTMIRALTQR